jgi:UTP--glucose-1-phosphate uridylyltransferase
MSQTIRKAVIPAAGFGTRMLPAAKAIPKEMLPVLDLPTIQYVVQECADAGADDVLLVTSRDKKAVEDHFDAHAELESRLFASGKSDLLRSLRELSERVKVHSVRQPTQRGLGDAVLQAQRHVGNEPFLCLLGDTIFSGAMAPAVQLVLAFACVGTSVIGVERVAPEKVERYGIVGGTEVAPGLLRLSTLVEKPKRDEAPSNLAIAARYLLTPAVFDCLRQTTPGTGGEIQLTDALRLLLEREPVHAVVLDAKRHDIGNPIDWLKTNLTLASTRTEFWSQLEPLVRALLEEKNVSKRAATS